MNRQEQQNGFNRTVRLLFLESSPIIPLRNYLSRAIKKCRTAPSDECGIQWVPQSQNREAKTL